MGDSLVDFAEVFRINYHTHVVEAGKIIRSQIIITFVIFFRPSLKKFIHFSHR